MSEEKVRSKDERTKASVRREKTAEETAEEMRALAKEEGIDVEIRAHPRAKELAGQTVLFFGPIAKDGYNRDVPRAR